VWTPRSLAALCVLALAAAGSVPAGAATSGHPRMQRAAPRRANASAAPTVSSTSITSVNQGETTYAIIKGTSFQRGAAVSLGSGVRSSVESVSASQIAVKWVIAPSATFGERTLTVTNPDQSKGVLKHAVHVDYIPVFAKWAIGNGAVNWTTTLVRPTFNTQPKLSFTGSGVTVSSESLNSAHQVIVAFTIDPIAATTWRDVTITSGLTTWFVPNGLKIRPAPKVTSVTPLGQGAAHQTVAVRGSNFEVCTSKEPTLAISGSGVTVNSVSSALGTLLYLNLTVASAAPLGPRDVTMSNCDSGGIATSTGVFTVSGAPQVTSIPAIAVGVSRKETVAGSAFTPLTTLTPSGSGVAFTHVVYISPTKMTIDIAADPSASLGPRDVTVANTGGASTLDSGVLGIDAQPTVTSVAPTTIIAPSSQTLTIYGTGFNPGASVVVGKGTIPNPRFSHGAVDLVSSGEIQVTLSADSRLVPGVYDVTVTNRDGGIMTRAGALTAFTRLDKPVVTARPSSVLVGALHVSYVGAANGPKAQGYVATTCANAAMTKSCVTRNALASGTEVTGLTGGGHYWVTVTARASTGYLASTSATVGPVRAAVRLVRPGAPVLRFGPAAGSLVVQASSSNEPAGQTFSVRACTNAAMTARCVVSPHVFSGGTATRLAFTKGRPGTLYFVEVSANPSSGYLASATSRVARHADTSQLAAPTITSATSPSTSAIKVIFSRPASSSSFAAKACRNAAMTSGCVAVAKFSSGGLIRGLVAKKGYFVDVTALATAGYAPSTSAVRGPVAVK
jgi:hypothetical protein